VPLRPLALGEILDGAFQAIRTNPRTMLGVSALVLVVTTVIGLIPQFYLMLQLRSLGDLGPEVTDDQIGEVLLPMLTAFGGLGVSTLLKLLATTVLSAFLVVAVGDAVIGRRMAPRGLWQRIRPRVGAVIGLSLLSLLIPSLVAVAGVGAAIALGVAGGAAGTGGGATALVVVLAVLVTLAATVWIAVRIALAGPALLLERVGVSQALRRSWLLVGGSWWRVFGIILLTSVITGIGAGVVSLPFSQTGSVLAMSGDPASPATLRVLLGTVLGGIGEIVGGTVMTPFSAAVTSLLYIDRRMRAEGLDIELTRAAQSPTSGPTAG
jgi:hypothetical protein